MAAPEQTSYRREFRFVTVATEPKLVVPNDHKWGRSTRGWTNWPVKDSRPRGRLRKRRVRRLLCEALVHTTGVEAGQIIYMEGIRVRHC